MVQNSFSPDIIILEIGTNDLVDKSPEIIDSEIEDLVRLLQGNIRVGSFVFFLIPCVVIHTMRRHLCPAGRNSATVLGRCTGSNP